MLSQPIWPRGIVGRLQESLADTPVVLLNGRRQSGKTTLVRQFASEQRPYLTLDDATTCSAAREDPQGFIRRLDGAVIDEVQRVPELLLAIKLAVDERRRPGRFLLTGSADVMALPRVADSLAGRVEVLSLLPLAAAPRRCRGAARTAAAAIPGGRQVGWRDWLCCTAAIPQGPGIGSPCDERCPAPSRSADGSSPAPAAGASPPPPLGFPSRPPARPSPLLYGHWPPWPAQSPHPLSIASPPPMTVARKHHDRLLTQPATAPPSLPGGSLLVSALVQFSMSADSRGMSSPMGRRR
jgi:hypothetical protein